MVVTVLVMRVSVPFPLPPEILNELDVVPYLIRVPFCFSLLIPVWHSSLLQDLGAVQHSQAKRQTRQLL